MSYFAYLLRLWRHTEHEDAPWLASLEDVHGHERQIFTDLETLLAFLQAQTNAASSKPEETGERGDDVSPKKDTEP
jgi:hypothetical protein